MPDLEDSIRDALRSRSDAVVVHETSLRTASSRDGRRSYAPLLAAAVVLLLALATAAVVTQRGGGTKDRSGRGDTFVGYSWRLIRITDESGDLAVPRSKGGRLSFPSATAIEGSDTVNYMTGTMRVTDRGLTVVRYGGTDAAPSAGDRVVAAVDAVFRAKDGVSAEVEGDTLTVRVAATTLILTRLGVSQPTSAPSSTAPPSGVLGIVGHRWNLVGYSDSKGARYVEGSNAHISFPSTTSIQGSDSINGFGATLHLVDGGFTVSDYLSSAVGVGGSPELVRMVQAVDAVPSSTGTVRVSIEGTRLTLTTGDVTLTLTKGAAVAPGTADPSPTGSGSSS